MDNDVMLGGNEWKEKVRKTKTNILKISSDTHQLQFIKLHRLKLERFKSI